MANCFCQSLHSIHFYRSPISTLLNIWRYQSYLCYECQRFSPLTATAENSRVIFHTVRLRMRIIVLINCFQRILVAVFRTEVRAEFSFCVTSIRLRRINNRNVCEVVGFERSHPYSIQNIQFSAIRSAIDVT